MGEVPGAQGRYKTLMRGSWDTEVLNLQTKQQSVNKVVFVLKLSACVSKKENSCQNEFYSKLYSQAACHSKTD